MTNQSAALLWPRREVSWTYVVATLIHWQMQLLKLRCETWAFLLRAAERGMTWPWILSNRSDGWKKQQQQKQDDARQHDMQTSHCSHEDPYSIWDQCTHQKADKRVFKIQKKMEPHLTEQKKRCFKKEIYRCIKTVPSLVDCLLVCCHAEMNFLEEFAASV